MRLRFEVDYLGDEGPLAGEILEIDIKGSVSMEDKRRECDRFVKFIQAIIKE